MQLRPYPRNVHIERACRKRGRCAPNSLHDKISGQCTVSVFEKQFSQLELLCCQKHGLVMHADALVEAVQQINAVRDMGIKCTGPCIAMQ